MKDKDIEYISAIAETGSLTRAAEKLYLAQPSLTQYVHRLELDYGTQFFFRSKDGLKLTEEGRRFLKCGEEMQKEYAKMCRAIGMTGDSATQAEVGIASFIGTLLVPQYIAQFKERHPCTVLHIIDSCSEKLEELVAAGKLDFAVIHSVTPNSKLNYIRLLREGFVLAVPANDPDYARAAAAGEERPVITKEILAGKEFSILLGSPTNKQVVNRILNSAGIVPQISMSSSNLVSSMSLAEQGIGCAFASRSFAKYYGKLFNLRFFDFPQEWNACWDISIACRKDESLTTTITDSVAILNKCIADMPEVFEG